MERRGKAVRQFSFQDHTSRRTYKSKHGCIVYIAYSITAGENERGTPVPKLRTKN